MELKRGTCDKWTILKYDRGIFNAIEIYETFSFAYNASELEGLV